MVTINQMPLDDIYSKKYLVISPMCLYSHVSPVSSEGLFLGKMCIGLQLEMGRNQFVPVSAGS